MAKATITPTDTYGSAVASGECVITILTPGNGTLFINETATDVNANRYGADLKANHQLTQNSAVDTFIRSSGDKDWEILIDGVI